MQRAVGAVASTREIWRERARRAVPAMLAGGLGFVVADRLGLVTVLGVRRLLDVDDAFLLFVAALAAGALALTERARWVPWASAGSVLALFVVVAHTRLLLPTMRSWALREAPRRADAIVVLSSDVTESGHLDANALTRYVAALALARDGWAPLLVRTDLPPHRPDDAADARALAAGVDVELARVGPVSSTRDEALAAAALLRERGLRTAIVVTQPMHERRAAAAFRAAGIEVIAVPAPERGYSLPELPEADDRVRAFDDWITEQAAWTLYSMRGWLMTEEES